MIIRKTKLGELPIVSALYADANLFARPKDIKAWTRQGLKKFPQLNWVCEGRNGQIVGAVSAVLVSKQTAVINDIVVSQKHRNQRIGEQLMQTIFDVLRSQKVRRVKVWVHWKNARAIPFYYQLGFRIKKALVTQGIEGVPDGEDVVYLTRNLTQ